MNGMRNHYSSRIGILTSVRTWYTHFINIIQGSQVRTEIFIPPTPEELEVLADKSR